MGHFHVEFKERAGIPVDVGPFVQGHLIWAADDLLDFAHSVDSPLHA